MFSHVDVIVGNSLPLVTLKIYCCSSICSSDIWEVSLSVTVTIKIAPRQMQKICLRTVFAPVLVLSLQENWALRGFTLRELCEHKFLCEHISPVLWNRMTSRKPNEKKKKSSLTKTHEKLIGNFCCFNTAMLCILTSVINTLYFFATLIWNAKDLGDLLMA